MIQHVTNQPNREGCPSNLTKNASIEIKPRLKMTWKSPDALLKTEMTRGWERMIL
jgi:hypothetical protein